MTKKYPDICWYLVGVNWAKNQTLSSEDNFYFYRESELSRYTTTCNIKWLIIRKKKNSIEYWYERRDGTTVRICYSFRLILLESTTQYSCPISQSLDTFEIHKLLPGICSQNLTARLGRRWRIDVSSFHLSVSFSIIPR